ncbi:uncharacterized protein LOC142237625 [Haematobia irritans]|uniref:uncharacterized protein LOC142237625 n=1 Tax=Haematobia irritans TaxID=7368 RepID=UPI003F4F93D5
MQNRKPRSSAGIAAAADTRKLCTARRRIGGNRRISKRQQELSVPKGGRRNLDVGRKMPQQRPKQSRLQPRGRANKSKGSNRNNEDSIEDSENNDGDNQDINQEDENEKDSESDEEEVSDVEDNEDENEDSEANEELDSEREESENKASSDEEDHENKSEDEHHTDDDDDNDDDEAENSDQLTRSRLRSLRGSTSGSSNKKSQKIVAWVRKTSQRLSLDSQTTNRKTTRTSIAAARAGNRTLQPRTRKLSSLNDKNRRSKDEEDPESSTKVKTGVKNQKILSFAKNRRKEMARKKSQNQLKRKSSLSPGKAQPAKRRAIAIKGERKPLRHSPRKLANRGDDNGEEVEEAEEENNDDDGDELNEKDPLNDEATAEEDCLDDTVEENEDVEEGEDDDNDNENEEEEEEENEEDVEQPPTSVRTYRARPIPLRSRGGKTMKPQDDDDDETDEETNTKNDNGDEGEPNDDDEEEEDKSSYATAGENIAYDNDQAHADGGNSSSMDTWNVHNQAQDTTTNSTYYNVSDESDSDENDTLGSSLNSTLKKTPLSNARSLRSSITGSSGLAADSVNFTTPQRNDNHTPRTRSRGSVKINLWKLDDSPLLHSTPAHSRESHGRHNRTESESHKDSEQSDKSIASTSNPLRTPSSVASKRLTSQASKSNETPTKSSGNITTLHRWLLKTPRSRSNSASTSQPTNGGPTTKPTVNESS